MRRRADDAETLIVVAGGVGDRQPHARVLFDLLIERPRDIAERSLQVKNRVEHKLQLRAARAQHGVKPDSIADEGFIALRLDREDGHHQAAAQRDGKGRNERGERVLPQTAPHDE